MARILLILLLSSTLRAQSPEAVFTEAWLVARSAFYDEKMNGADWNAIRDELAPKAAATTTPAALSAVINDALARLHASHTARYMQDQREYYELLDVFWPEAVPARDGSKIVPGRVQYVGIGLAAKVVDGHVFAEDVYDGGPAARAGILPGDELVAVEGGPWGDVAPFRERQGKTTTVTIQRRRDPDSRVEAHVVPALIRPRELFLSSLKESARLIPAGGKQIAYVRIRSYAHPDYHDALKELLAGKLAGADGLVIDIRGGWGGASPQYMDIFNPTSPSLTYRSRDGKERVFSTTWRKPVAMIIDGGSRSGKEVICYAFKKHRIGPLVGERTAGAVLAGTPRPLADGSVLYIAINEVRVDGEVLEGAGVEPDVKVARRLPYSEGHDPQIDAAVKAVMEKLKLKPGTIGWIDLTVPGAERVREFYTKVVGWTHQCCDMGGYSDYTVGPAGAEPVAGICHARGPNTGLPACWLIYITVENLDASMKQVTALGGKVLHGPRQMGGMGRMCVIEDPSGAAAALFEFAT